MTILNQPDSYIFVDSFSALGFKLNNGVAIMGPCAVFPKTCLHWNVSITHYILLIFTAYIDLLIMLLIQIAGPEEINMESLSLFRVLEPKLGELLSNITY